MPEKRYIERGVPENVPDGRVLVHDHIAHERNTPVGTLGFRAWTEPAPPRRGLVPCNCGWAPRAGVHYRIGSFT